MLRSCCGLSVRGIPSFQRHKEKDLGRREKEKCNAQLTHHAFLERSYLLLGECLTGSVTLFGINTILHSIGRLDECSVRVVDG